MLVTHPHPIFNNFGSNPLHPDAQITYNLNILLMVVDHKSVVELFSFYF